MGAERGRRPLARRPSAALRRPLFHGQRERVGAGRPALRLLRARTVRPRAGRRRPGLLVRQLPRRGGTYRVQMDVRFSSFIITRARSSGKSITDTETHYNNNNNNNMTIQHFDFSFFSF